MLSGYGTVAGAAPAAAAPLVAAGLDWFGEVMGRRRLENDVDVVPGAADAYEAETGGGFAQFVQAAVSDAEHQELLARALTIGQDTALRDKRRALGRALASAAGEAGTKVDDEMLFVRVLADLDPPHIRCLAIMRGCPPRLDADNQRRGRLGAPPYASGVPPRSRARIRDWLMWSPYFCLYSTGTA